MIRSISLSQFREGSAMGMSHEEMDRVVDDHFRFEATDDLDGVMASFAPGPLRHEIIPSPIGEISDRQDIRDYYTMLYACAQGDKATCIRRLYGDDFLVGLKSAESRWGVHELRRSNSGHALLDAGRGGLPAVLQAGGLSGESSEVGDRLTHSAGRVETSTP